jgi:hypothetical protein
VTNLASFDTPTPQAASQSLKPATDAASTPYAYPRPDARAHAAILSSEARLPEAPRPVDQQALPPPARGTSGTAARSPPPKGFQSWLMQAAGVAGREAQRGVALAEGLVPELKTWGMVGLAS